MSNPQHADGNRPGRRIGSIGYDACGVKFKVMMVNDSPKKLKEEGHEE